jgi:predicted helicase
VKNSIYFVAIYQNPNNWGTKGTKNQGITLISYLSNNAYYVAIDSKFYSQSTVSKNIRTAITIDSSFKIDPLL